MNIRRATTSAAVGIALAISAASPAHAGQILWTNYPFSSGQTQASSSANLTSIIGTSSNGWPVKIAQHVPGSWDVTGTWVQANGGICMYWSGTRNVGMLLNNGTGSPQQMQGYIDTPGNVC